MFYLLCHIVCIKNISRRKNGKGGPDFEMRWATAEDFMELKVMPRMLVDHLPDNVLETIETVLKEQKEANGGKIESPMAPPSPITEII